MSSCAETLTVYNPYDSSLVTSGIQVAGEKEINAAVEAAQYQYSKGPWSKFTGAQRAACMLKFADLVEQNMEELARLETICVGKPISGMLGWEIPHMTGCYRCMLVLQTSRRTNPTQVECVEC